MQEAAEVPDLTPPADPRAESDGARSEANVAADGPGDSPVANAPARDSGLFVRALGPDGETVPGAAVEWVIRSKLGGIGESPIRGVTGEDGLMEIPDGEEFLSRFFGGGPGTGYVAALGLRCAMPFEELVPDKREDEVLPGVTWLEDAPSAGTVIDVEVPPHGFVRFTWDPPEDPRGGTLHASWIQVRRSDGDHFPGWRAGGPLPDGATEFTFGPVELGWEVWGQITAGGMEGHLGAGTGVGPLTAGETVDLEIELTDEQQDLVALTGRIVFTGGTVHGRPNVWVKFGPRDAPRAPGHRVAIDETRGFGVVIARSAVPRVVTLMDDYSRPTWIGSRPVPPGPGDARVIDLGEVTVGPVPEVPAKAMVALASGRVVDADGAPLARANVFVYGYATRVGDHERDPERLLPLASARTEADGTFALEHSVDLARDNVRIMASADGFERFPMETIPSGSTGLELALTRGADVRFQLKIPRWALLMEKVSMGLGDAPGPRNDPQATAAEGVLAMRFSGVPAGTHTFTVELGDGDWPLHTAEVKVTGDDVDLGLIDLSDALRICRLQLLDAGGSPVTEGYVQIGGIPATGGRGRDIDSERVDEDGGVTFVVPGDAEGLMVWHREAGRAEVPAGAMVPAPDDGKIARVKVILGP